MTNPYLYLFLFLACAFAIFPLMLCYHPKRVADFWHRKQQTQGCAKFVAHLHFIAAVLFNVLYYGCYSGTIGFVLSSIAMLPLANTKWAVAMLRALRSNNRVLAYFAFATVALAFYCHTFPLAVIIGLMVIFACLLPQQNKTVHAEATDSETDGKVKPADETKTVIRFVADESELSESDGTIAIAVPCSETQENEPVAAIATSPSVPCDEEATRCSDRDTSDEGLSSAPSETDTDATDSDSAPITPVKKRRHKRHSHHGKRNTNNNSHGQNS